MNGVTGGQRIDWVDYAKGICIILVVMMHSTIGLEHATGQQGWMHNVVEFAKPFRMPDFFLLAGLFLASRINAPTIRRSPRRWGLRRGRPTHACGRIAIAHGNCCATSVSILTSRSSC